MRDPGQMQDRLLLERPVKTPDATGGESVTWATVRTVWARRLSEKGVETFAGAALLGKVEAGFAIRYWPAHGLDQEHRFTHAGRVYNISSVVESERRTELVLLGTSGANRG